VASIRIILHGKAAADARVRAAVLALRKDGHVVEVRVTREPTDAARLTVETVAEAQRGHIDCIVAGGGDGTINEVFAAAYAAQLPETCALGLLPLGTANESRLCSIRTLLFDRRRMYQNASCTATSGRLG
jgi:diacylglycerol kinase family enzyme